MFVNLMIDEEDPKYSYVIVTKNDCKALIEDCVETYYACNLAGNIDEFLNEEDFGEFIVDSRIMNILQQKRDQQISDFGNALFFTEYVLQCENEYIKTETHRIYW